MKTNKGRSVEVVEGRPDDIGKRGEQIRELGESMVAQAKTLRDIENGSIVGKGYTMEKIREVIGSVHHDLDEAGRRYTPAGTVLTAYATALQTAQNNMTRIKSDCETSLSALETAQTEAAEAAGALEAHETSTSANPPAPEDASSNAATGRELSSTASTAATTLGNAEKAHDENLEAFDKEYDTWQTAYEDAVSGLTDANKIGEDTNWENVAGVLAVISEWVGWIGLAVAVLGLLIGGPIFALVAVVLGVIALGLTIALMFDGRKNVGDLLWSVVGILPIGKLGKVFSVTKGSRLAQFGQEFRKQFTYPAQQLRGMKAFSKTNIEYGSRGFREYYSGLKGMRSGFRNASTGFTEGIAERMFFGANRTYATAFHESFQSGGAFFQQKIYSSMSPGMRALTNAPTYSMFEAAWNSYKWTDRGISLMVNERPSGALSPAGPVNGLFR